MAARNKPYDQFGPYILFKKLEADALGELWRAARIDGGQVGPTVALRRLTGGNRQALIASAEAAADLLPQLTGTSFMRDQVVGVIDGVPYLAYGYAGGRSLRHIIDRARGGKDTPPNPLPMDQAIVIAERIALSLATTAELRDGSGVRLSHGALIPQFVWISDDGEIRVGGQQLGSGLIASLSDSKVSTDIARYFSPELRTSVQSKNGDVYSLGAILFLLVTGQEPPDAATASAFGAAVRAAKTMAGAPVPDDIRLILDKSFNIDPSMRYASIADMKAAISALAHGGKYSASTFNLAFYLSTLLKKEMESEALDREKESKVNLTPYLEVAKPAAPVAVAAGSTDGDNPMFASVDGPPKSKLPLAIAAGVILAGVAIGSYFMFVKKPAAPATTVAAAQALPVPKPQPPKVISEPIVATPQATTTATATDAATLDEAAKKKAFEDAVRQKLNEEMMKLQGDFMAELKQKQSRNAPVAAPAPSSPVPAPRPQQEERPSMSAAQLDQQRRDTAPAREQVAEQPQQPAPAVTQTQAPAPVPQQPANVPAPAPTVRAGDVVEAGELDAIPKPLRAINVVYPPLARQQKISATVVLSAFVDESGRVQDVKILRGDARFGINDAAIRAMRGARFSPPMKDGKAVKTWMPQTIDFRP